LALPEARFVRAQVFNVAGRRVADLVNRRMEAGRWDISWDGRSSDGSTTGAGIYLIRIQAGEDIVTRKAICVR
jgi:flagellar hook assembly protein FlgD